MSVNFARARPPSRRSWLRARSRSRHRSVQALGRDHRPHTATADSSFEQRRSACHEHSDRCHIGRRGGRVNARPPPLPIRRSRHHRTSRVPSLGAEGHFIPRCPQREVLGDQRDRDHAAAAAVRKRWSALADSKSYRPRMINFELLLPRLFALLHAILIGSLSPDPESGVIASL